VKIMTACSVSTIIPHELERVDEEDEKVAAECEDRCCSTMRLVDHEPRTISQNNIINCLKTLSSQIESKLELSQSLQVQQASAQNTIHQVTELQQPVQVMQDYKTASQVGLYIVASSMEQAGTMGPRLENHQLVTGYTNAPPMYEQWNHQSAI